jgi:hypothetical protein
MDHDPTVGSVAVPSQIVVLSAELRSTPTLEPSGLAVRATAVPTGTVIDAVISDVEPRALLLASKNLEAAWLQRLALTVHRPLTFS